MTVIDVYSQYFKADCVFSGVPRRGAVVKLTSTSDQGHITYAFSVSFFRYQDPEDFSISCDAYAEKVVYDAPGRRSRKREAEMLKALRPEIDTLAAGMEGTVFWDQPLREARMG